MEKNLFRKKIDIHFLKLFLVIKNISFSRSMKKMIDWKHLKLNIVRSDCKNIHL